MKVIQRFDSKVNTCALIGWRKVRHWPIIARHQAEWGGGGVRSNWMAARESVF